MFRYTVKRMLREPVPRLAVILFGGIMALLLCLVQISLEREQESRQYIYENTPIPVYITNLTGTRKDDLAISGSTVYAFENGLISHYLTDIALKIHTYPNWIKMGEEMLPMLQLVGITALKAAPELAVDPEKLVEWRHGFDEAMLREDKPVCILPRSLVPENGEVPETVLVHFEATVYDAETEQNEILQFDIEFAVAGYHTNENRIYCPASVVESVLRRLYMPVEYDSASGVLTDNSDMDKLRQASSAWFAEPSLTNGVMDTKYTFALLIDDSQLRAADEAMAQSENVNRICSTTVFVMGAVAGFLIGFLTVRSRKREIALMRTMGTPNRAVFVSFMLEQMLCMIFGVLLGGSYHYWNPADRLAVLVGIYFVGLASALLIFLRKNLLTAIKEDE